LRRRQNSKALQKYLFLMWREHHQDASIHEQWPPSALQRSMYSSVSISSTFHPPPIPKITRPFDRLSRLESASASSTPFAGKNPRKCDHFGRVHGEMFEDQTGCWSELDLNLRAPSISLSVIMVSIVQPMKTRFGFEQTKPITGACLSMMK
jgi:hypothetical protein